MMDLREIERAIAELENGPTSLQNCAKLADLYAVRKGLLGEMEPFQMASYNRAYSQAAEPDEKPLEQYGNSDFLRTVAEKNSAGAWAVIDELMDTLKVVNPRVYDSVMRKIGRL